ncbi:hypothetical protein [Flavobacterium facile]|uniref:hypothetical protein n=1 Tax=Flavobacterium facile TaxID=2893174 RepID=UPI002E79ED63|nr:hypothetical protein [Flavobacterium sp. T-12]
MSVKERLKIYIKYSNLSVSTFEKSINVSNGYVNNMQKSIGIDKLELILEIYSNLSLEWLFTGKGEMLRGIEEKKAEKAENNYMAEELLQFKEEQLQFYKEKIESLTEKLENCESEKKLIKNSTNKF